ncbi:MAG: HEAT repeat domain-containing protein [Planctomycetes bacterium]|nr:HEAT repeat domain-containing protein [Planctomycetota bacterium]
MRIILSLIVALLAATSAFAEGELGADTLVQSLRDKNPEVRRSAARILATYKVPESVEGLVEALADEQDPVVKKEIFGALHATTNENIEDDAAKWTEWFNKSGGRFAKTISLGARRELDNYQRFLTISIVLNVLILVMVIGFLVAFGAMASNRMKAMKELTRQADILIKEGNDVARKSGSVMEGLDAKKNEMMAFFSKLKDENESEIERYGDMIEQNIEHRMREITMTLREKAEKELEQTFNELKEDLARRIKTSSEEQKDSLLRELTKRQQGFLADVEAHTLFLEASFFYISGKLPDSIRVYRKLLALKPDHYIAWNNFGTILRDVMRYDEALEAYQKALDQSPDNPGVLFLFATVFALQKKKDKMLEFLKKSIAFDGEFKDEALNEKSFKEYWEDPEFKDVAEG